jgi:hypothetical protein
MEDRFIFKKLPQMIYVEPTYEKVKKATSRAKKNLS